MRPNVPSRERLERARRAEIAALASARHRGQPERDEDRPRPPAVRHPRESRRALYREEGPALPSLHPEARGALPDLQFPWWVWRQPQALGATCRRPCKSSTTLTSSGHLGRLSPLRKGHVRRPSPRRVAGTACSRRGLLPLPRYSPAASARAARRSRRSRNRWAIHGEAVPRGDDERRREKSGTPANQYRLRRSGAYSSERGRRSGDCGSRRGARHLTDRRRRMSAPWALNT